MANVIGIHLTRGQNRLMWACHSARKEIENFLSAS
jgi:hypothetical protein